MFNRLADNNWLDFINGRSSCFPIINSVIERKQTGEIFFVDANNFFILHKAGFGELFGFDAKDQVSSFLNFIYNESILPKYFHIYNASPLLLKSIFTDSRYNIKERERIQFSKFLEDRSLNNGNINLPSNYSVSEINISNFDSLNVFNLDLSNRFWSSKEDFLANGFGVILQNENAQAVALCYSACIAGSKVEIDVMTSSSYQKRGFAKLMVSEFLKQCQRKNFIANWDCFKENIGSFKTAISCGFKEINKYTFLSVFKKNDI